MNGIVDHHCRRGCALAQAVHRFQRKTAVGAMAVQAAAQRALRVAQQRVGAHALAGFGPAHLHHVARRRRAAKVVIESEHAMHFGARQVERQGNGRHRFRRNETGGVLDRMQRGQQLIGAGDAAGQDGAGLEGG
jgi:hypothetical protein